MVAALIDRLTFRSHVLDMNGDSYWLMATMHKRARKAQKLVSVVAHFFIDIYIYLLKSMDVYLFTKGQRLHGESTEREFREDAKQGHANDKLSLVEND